MEFYNISEAEVFEKSLALYRKAIELDPNNFLLRSSYAQSFYGTKPQRLEEGLAAWKEAFKVARDEVEQQGVLIHLARCAMNTQHFDEASNFLDGITNKMYLDLKTRLTKRMGVLKTAESSTNSPSANDNP
jgi:tetratricopeptide (TPR) repeat protein